MRLASAAISTLVLSLFVFAHMALAAPQNEACSLPQDLQKEISTTYHGAQLVTISDLNESDRGLFEKDHGKSCPGLLRVDFYGDEKPTLALVLNTGDGANQKAELVVAHKVGPHRWHRALNEGARPQRLLWASTGTKDPKASDVLYIKSLAAPLTVNTMPDATLKALSDHGEIGAVLPADAGNSEQVLAQFGKAGIDIGALAAELQDEAAKSFVKSWNDLMAVITGKSATLKRAAAL